jgi:hypothetical protein
MYRANLAVYVVSFILKDTTDTARLALHIGIHLK